MFDQFLHELWKLYSLLCNNFITCYPIMIIQEVGKLPFSTGNHYHATLGVSIVICHQFQFIYHGTSFAIFDLYKQCNNYNPYLLDIYYSDCLKENYPVQIENYSSRWCFNYNLRSSYIFVYRKLRAIYYRLCKLQSPDQHSSHRN